MKTSRTHYEINLGEHLTIGHSRTFTTIKEAKSTYEKEYLNLKGEYADYWKNIPAAIQKVTTITETIVTFNQK